MTIKELQEQRGKNNELRVAMLEKAEGENRDLTDEENTNFKIYCDEDDALTARIQRLQLQEKQDADLLESSERRADLETDIEKRKVSPDEAGNRTAIELVEKRAAMNKWFMEGPVMMTDEERSLLDFAKIAEPGYSGTGIRMRLSPTPMTYDELRTLKERRAIGRWGTPEQRVQSVGTDTEGGFTVQNAPMQALEIALLEPARRN